MFDETTLLTYTLQLLCDKHRCDQHDASSVAMKSTYTYEELKVNLLLILTDLFSKSSLRGPNVKIFLGEHTPRPPYVGHAAAYSSPLRIPCIYLQGLIRGGGGGDGVASHPPFTCSFVHNTIGVGLSFTACQPPPIV